MGANSSNVANFRTKVVDVTIDLPASTEIELGELAVDATAFTVGTGRVIGTINNATVVDNDDKGVQLEFWFSDKQTAPTFGSAAAVPTISTADASTLIGKIDSSATFTDLVNSKVAVPAAFSPIAFAPDNGQLYVGTVLRGATTTFGSGDVVLRLSLTIEQGY